MVARQILAVSVDQKKKKKEKISGPADEK